MLSVSVQEFFYQLECCEKRCYGIATIKLGSVNGIHVGETDWHKNYR